MKWTDEYWPLLLQMYLQKPVGIKPMYSRPLVALALELHIHPSVLYKKQCELSGVPSPSVSRMWKKYGSNPRKLNRVVQMIRDMKGFCHEEEFYRGVAMNETFEQMFQPIKDHERITPIMLILLLDLYYRLTPATMVADTPEVMTLSKTMGIRVDDAVDILTAFQYCDPYLHREGAKDSCLMEACRKVWGEYGNIDPNELMAQAEQLRHYFG